MSVNYLVLHIDMEFIVGAISTGYGTPHPILVDDDPLMWLYFFNDPNCHRVSFGKGYKRHYMDREYNYYGKFLKCIEDDSQEFLLRHTKYPIVELLEESGILKLWKEEYTKVTHSTPTIIPTLLSFSSTIGDLGKQRFVDFIRKKGFDVQSYTIPISELAFFKLFENNKVSITAGHSALMLEATNATLHFTKLTYADNYFLRDGEVKSIVGKGIDPRKRAICKFLVGELNSMNGILSSDEEREEEIERFELLAGDWLKRLDAMNMNRPLQIKHLSFARAPHSTHDILVNKNNLESDTGRYLQDIVSEYEAFVSEVSPNGIDFCCFIGNCFLSERIRSKFESLIGKDNTFFYKTIDIPEIISCYPRIDLKRYSDEENRIRERAKIDALKQEQEKQADLLRKQQEEMEKAVEEAERLRRQQKQQAEESYRQALDLDKIGHYQDAKIAIDKAINFDSSNIEYRKWANYLSEKIKTMQEKIMLYKKYLSAGDKCFETEQYDAAVEEYKKAKEVDDNADINKKIIECNFLIAKQQERQTQIKALLSKANELIEQNDFDAVENTLISIFKMDPNNKDADKLKMRISSAKANDLYQEGETFYNEGDYSQAIELYNKALNLDSDLKICKSRIKRCKELMNEKKTAQKQEKSELINQKDRKIREFRAIGKSKCRNNDFDGFKKIVTEFLVRCHSLGINIYDSECEKLLHDFLQTPQKEDGTGVKTNGSKQTKRSNGSINMESGNKKTESSSSHNKDGSPTQQTPIKTIPVTAQELFTAFRFKEAMDLFAQEGNEEMRKVCVEFRNIQKRISIREQELASSTRNRAEDIIPQLEEHLNKFKKYQLSTDNLEKLIEKYKSIN